MRGFGDHNPIAVAVYYLAVTGIAMFCMDPVIYLLSLLGAVSLFAVQAKGGRSHRYYLCLFLAFIIINPLVSHNGTTVLFFINNNPITLESAIYGACAATMILSVLYWFRSFSAVMTGDKLLYLFGAFSPKIALVLSMGLRYIPLFSAQAKKVNQTQKALGLYKDENMIDGLKGGLRVFSVMVTWVLENGIITADSMTARGYGLGKRSRFSLFRFHRSDYVLLGTTAVLFGCAIMGIRTMAFQWYPMIVCPALTPMGLMGYIAYGMLAMLPLWIEGKEFFKWKYLQRSI